MTIVREHNILHVIMLASGICHMLVWKKKIDQSSLLLLLYSHLLMCKTIGMKLAAQKYVSFLENPIAVGLGLDDPNGPSVLLAQAMEALGDHYAMESNMVYIYLLDACKKVFNNKLDQATFDFWNKVKPLKKHS
jgi:C-terminal domain of Sin3a protein